MTTTAAVKREWLYACLLLGLGCAFYAFFVVQDFSGPLVGGEDYDGAYRGDANYYEFLGYFVRDHWHFGLSPIDFFTKDVAYPHGTHIGLLSWCAERDLWNAHFLKLFGPGPWVQLYVTVGACLGAFGVFFVLREEYGVLRSAMVGFAASFMAFYAWYKYPYHVNMVPIHWVVISIAADAVTMKTVAAGRRLDMSFLVLRTGILLCAFGLDLGYITGHALTSFTITLYCVWSLLGTRDKRLLGRFALALPEAPIAELRGHPGRSILGAVLIGVGLLLYFPFVLAVVRDSRAYPMIDIGGNFWASQFNALFPYLPGLHPTSTISKALFGSVEGIGEYRPGFTLLIAAGVGIWLARKRDMAAPIKPLVITFLLILAFHPRWCKTLQVFPWFAYHRVAGRGTTVMPVLLALIAASADNWPKLAKRIVAGFAIAEYLTAVFLVNHFRPARLEAKQKAYFETVSKAPGKALLEWPFCIASAHTLITRELCPYYDRIATAYANRRFHEKATVGVYLSRVHPLQFKPWLDDGWEGMFMPDDPKREHPKKELRCFDDEQWARFDRLYRGHDFAGIQLYADLLPEPCIQQFHVRYGAPSVTETLPRLGRVEFIPRSVAPPKNDEPSRQ